MNCPDCKFIEMDYIEPVLHDNAYEPYWKCPKCKLEQDQEDIIEDRANDYD